MISESNKTRLPLKMVASGLLKTVAQHFRRIKIMREPDGTMFIIGMLIASAIAVAGIGIGFEIYLKWYINN